MKKTSFKEKSSVLFIGKGIIIVSIIVTSSLSFILGFFVGKSYHPPVESQTSIISLQEHDLQKNMEIEKNEAELRSLGALMNGEQGSNLVKRQRIESERESVPKS